MKKLRVIIVSLPGTWQRVLQNNLEAYSFVDVIDTVGGTLSASRLAIRHQPDVVLIDSSIPVDDAVVLIQTLKKDNSKTLSVVITDTTQQQGKMSRSGADYAILSMNYETLMDEILNKLKEALLDERVRSGIQDKTTQRSD